MIYGLIPIGGKGTRMGLPFSKEMLPQRGYNFYNPIVNHLVEKMKIAGAEKICFVHGEEFKQDVCDHFEGDEHIHLLQNKIGFANVILDFINNISISNNDIVIFGLPDSIFEGNVFSQLISKQGIVIGLFVTDDDSKVDRLSVSENKFQVKVAKTHNNLNLFWGTLKFDGSDLMNMTINNVFETYTEIGDILNLYEKTFIQCGNYIDLGTWSTYNKYLNNPPGIMEPL